MSTEISNAAFIELVEANDLEEVNRWLTEGGNPNHGEGEENYIPWIQDILDEIYDSGENEALFQMLVSFINHGVNLNPKSVHFIPILEAVVLKSPRIFNLFIENGADPNVLSEERESIIFRALTEGNLEMLELSLQHASKELLHITGGIFCASPLGLSFINLNFDAIQLLLQNGANPYFEEWDFGHAQSRKLTPSEISQADLMKIDDLISKYSQFEAPTK